MYIVTNKSQKCFFISISILGRSGVNRILWEHAPECTILKEFYGGVCSNIIAITII